MLIVVVSRSSFTANTYTTRSWVGGFGANTGGKVVTKAVNGVEAGKEFWFPHVSMRSFDTGITATMNGYRPGQIGYYWSSTGSGSSAYRVIFQTDYRAGNLDLNEKLRAESVRCVR